MKQIPKSKMQCLTIWFHYLMMPKIFLGMRPRPVTRSSFVGLIGSEGPMRRDTIIPLIMPNPPKNLLRKMQRQCLAFYFNQGTCNQSKTYETKGMLYRHVCSACFTNGKTFNHSEIDCKNKHPKTSKFGCSSEHSRLSHACTIKIFRMLHQKFMFTKQKLLLSVTDGLVSKI